LENPVVPEKQVLTRQEAAAYLGIHYNTLDKSAIPRIRIGKKILFRKSTLEKFLASEERQWKPRKGGGRG
jgi:excisionase family DNA binding protein